MSVSLLIMGYILSKTEKFDFEIKNTLVNMNAERVSKYFPMHLNSSFGINFRRNVCCTCTLNKLDGSS